MSAVALSLVDLAVQINAEHIAATEHARSAVQRACCAGELLLEAKRQCAHGQWLPWLKANCPAISARSIQGYIRLARHCLSRPQAATDLQALSLREALARLSAAEIRNGCEFVEPEEAFTDICIAHLEEHAGLERRLAKLRAELDAICAAPDADERRPQDLEALASILSAADSLQTDLGVLHLRMQRHLGQAFRDGATLADVIGATPHAVMEAIGIDGVLTLEDWLTSGAPIHAMATEGA